MGNPFVFQYEMLTALPGETYESESYHARQTGQVLARKWLASGAKDPVSEALTMMPDSLHILQELVIAEFGRCVRKYGEPRHILAFEVWEADQEKE